MKNQSADKRVDMGGGDNTHSEEVSLTQHKPTVHDTLNGHARNGETLDGEN